MTRNCRNSHRATDTTPYAGQAAAYNTALVAINGAPVAINGLRRRLLGTFVCVAAAAALVGPRRAASDPVQVEVWKSPTCGCCNDWIDHLRSNGFSVRSHDVGNAEARERLGMPVRYGSCHTAEVGGYAIEGHVPAPEIHRLLEEKPDAVGLSVPAMPRGSPGMDGPAYDGIKDPYDVLLVGHDGEARVFQSYRDPALQE